MLLALPAKAESLTGPVIGVHVGDTLTLLLEWQSAVKVRLAGIGAPELALPYGDKAKRPLQKPSL